MAVEFLGVAFVEDHEHRVLLGGVEVLGGVEHAFRRVAGEGVPLHELCVAPVVVLHLRVGVGHLLGTGEVSGSGYPHVGGGVEVGFLESVSIGVFGLADLRKRVFIKRLQRWRGGAAGLCRGQAVALVGIVEHLEEQLLAGLEEALFRVGLDEAVAAVGVAAVTLCHVHRGAFSRRVEAPDIVLVVDEHCVVALHPSGYAVGLAH